MFGDLKRRIRDRGEVRHWEAAGRPVPPPHGYKSGLVRQFGQDYGLSTLVETGTYHGRMVAAVRREFGKIITIELDEGLAQRTASRFARNKHITVLNGDSGKLLPQVLGDIQEPCLFWLDAHYSGEGTARAAEDSPVLREIGCILDNPIGGHVVLIDDAREFDGSRGYPTIDSLREFVGRRSGWSVSVESDIIRVVPE